MTDFRQTLPAGVKTYVCKNTLLKVAAEKVGGWESLKDCAKVVADAKPESNTCCPN